jgi:transmembrane Fragile-X-F protein
MRRRAVLWPTAMGSDYLQGMSRAIADTAYLIALVTIIVLKLAGVLNWSWWWILAPLWIGLIGIIGLFVVAMGWPSKAASGEIRTHGPRINE